MLNECKLFLLDFDFTLVDSSKGIINCFNNAFIRLGSAPKTNEEILSTIGEPLECAYLSLTGTKLGYRKFHKLFLDRSEKVMASYSSPLPHTKEAVKLLTEKGKKLGIVSSKNRTMIERILDKFELLSYFQVIVGEEDVQLGKPHSEGIDKAISMTGESKDRTVYIGDHPIDAEFARNAGVSFIPVFSGTNDLNDFSHLLSSCIVYSENQVLIDLARSIE